MGYDKIEEYTPETTEDLKEHYQYVLSPINEDPQREGLVKTPERAAKAMQYLTHGYDLDTKEILTRALFKEEYS